MFFHLSAPNEQKDMIARLQYKSSYCFEEFWVKNCFRHWRTDVSLRGHLIILDRWPLMIHPHCIIPRPHHQFRLVISIYWLESVLQTVVVRCWLSWGMTGAHSIIPFALNSIRFVPSWEINRGRDWSNYKIRAWQQADLFAWLQLECRKANCLCAAHWSKRSFHYRCASCSHSYSQFWMRHQRKGVLWLIFPCRHCSAELPQEEI